MTDDKRMIDLSRRQVLGGLGTIGLASAGAGLGTTAFLNDTESFENNILTAGSLDLTVDWEEHYWNDFDTEIGVELVSGPGDVTDGQVALPDPENPMVAVAQEDLQAFMDATAIEAFPDAAGENGGEFDGIQEDLSQYDACADFAQLPEDLNDPENSLRSVNSDTVDEEGEAKPLVALDDIKPGDFGELTLSFHLCDNPGYVWLQGEPVFADENGHTEPEADSDDETGASDELAETPADVLNSDVELLDEIQTMLWYDEDGDNVYEPSGEEGEEVDVVLVLDRSGSMSGTKEQEMRDAAINLVNALNLGANAAQVGVVSFADQERLDHGLSTDAASVVDSIDVGGSDPGIDAGGSTNIEGGVNAGEEELTGADLSDISPSGNDRSTAQKIMVVLSDGSPNVDDGGDSNDSPIEEATRAKGNGIEMYTIGFGISSGSSTATLLENMASDPTADHAYLGDEGELEQIFGQISQQIAGEEAFFRGSLRELLTQVSDGDGIPLDGDRSTGFDEVNGSDTAAERDPFVNSTNNFIGLAWWVPRSTGNQIQSDSVGFNLGFYTEQSRHNDGAGAFTTTTNTTQT